MPQSTIPASVKVLTLCLVTDPGSGSGAGSGRVLLGMKKRGFGAGRWNGFGGKVEPGETVPEAARRELREEAGIDALALSPCGLLRFTFEGDPVGLEVHVFRTSAFTGDPVETEEMRPQWYGYDAVPFDAMWPDDRHWLAEVLAGRHVRGTFRFEGQDRITDYELAVQDEPFPALAVA